MTNEEAKMFLDDLKVCIDEHPVVADWLVEIADRKTENSSENPNNFDKDINVRSKTEPQMERHLPDYSYEADLGRRIMEQTDCSWK